MSEHTSAHNTAEMKVLLQMPSLIYQSVVLAKSIRLVQERNNTASVCGLVMPCGPQTGLQCHFCFLNKLSLRLTGFLGRPNQVKLSLMFSLKC